VAEYVDCRPSEPPAMNGNHENSSEPVNMRSPKIGAGHKKRGRVPTMESESW
jgi:hypothetical protein